MNFQSAGYQLLPVLPELVLAAGAMVLLMIGAYRGPQTTGLVTGLAVCLLVAGFRWCDAVVVGLLAVDGQGVGLIQAFDLHG